MAGLGLLWRGLMRRIGPHRYRPELRYMRGRKD